MRYDDLRDEYRRLWDTALHTDAFVNASKATAKKVHAGKPRYQQIEAELGVPWYVVGAVHAMESGCRWSCHLHNGDPLTARTRLVPAGRPKGGKPPFTWEESARDALTMKGWHQIESWPIERILYECERYNGFGYRKYHKDVLSKYVWSGTQWGAKPGRYVADGKWSSTAVSKQTGVAAILMRLVELDKSITLTRDEPPLPEQPIIEPDLLPVPETFPKAEPAPVAEAVEGSRTVTGALAAFLGVVASYFSEAMKALVDTAAQLSAWSPAQNVLGAMGVNIKGIGFGLAVAGLALVLTRRFSAAREGKIG